MNLVKSNHVINVEEIKSSDGQSSYISGYVIRQTSVTSVPHKFIIFFNKNVHKIILKQITFKFMYIC